jgi:iron complex transport system ATP-binding protein
MKLVAQNISVYAGRRALLHAVSLQIEPGELLAVIGPNGAGKSSLLKVLSGELRPASGGITLNGRALKHWPMKTLARMRAVLPQQSNLNFPFAVREVVAMGRSPHASISNPRHDRDIIAAALAAADVEHLTERDYTTLSGGEHQRVHLARVLTQIWEPVPEGPRYLLMDEPTSALDLVHQHHVLAVARRFAVEQGVGVLTILHDLNLVAGYADRVAVLQGGRLRRQGTVAEVLQPEFLEEVFGIPLLRLPHPSDPRQPVLIVKRLFDAGQDPVGDTSPACLDATVVKQAVNGAY